MIEFDSSIGDEEIKQIEAAATEHSVSIIAEVAHETNRAYCASIGDGSHPAWVDAPQWQRDSAIKGVWFTMSNIEATPEDSHKSWMQQKIEDGWVYGEIKDAEFKTHPCMLSYNELPLDQRSKDFIYQAVVKTLILRLELID
jgi:hypothetical protein